MEDPHLPAKATEFDSGTSSVCSGYLEEEEEVVNDDGVKKLIKPDNLAITKLLNFDDDTEDEDDTADNSDIYEDHTDAIDNTQNYYIEDNTKNFNESKRTEVVGENPKTKTLQNTCAEELFLQPVSLPNLPGRRDQGRGVEEHKDESQSEESISCMKLEEVKHIRMVLSKARLETLPIKENLRETAKKGRVCSLCLKTKFWLFRRGVQCSICCYIVCDKCRKTIREPTDSGVAASFPFQSQALAEEHSQSQLALPTLQKDPTSKGSTHTSQTKPSMLSVKTVNVDGYLHPSTFEPVSLPVVLGTGDAEGGGSRRRTSLGREDRGDRMITVCIECKLLVQEVHLQCE